MTTSTVFLFSGQGSQYAGMARDLYREDALFRAAVEELDRHVAARTGRGVLDRLYGAAPAGTFDDLLVTHPAIFMVQCALIRTLEGRGVRPDYVLGTSLGEFAAAVAAGILGAEQALDAVLEQARLIAARCPVGAMLTVLGPTSLRADVPALGRCELVADNGAGHFVVAGPRERIEAAQAELSGRGVDVLRLPVRYAFHTAELDPAADEYARQTDRLTAGQPRVPVVSAALGGFLDGPPAPSHWWQVARAPIRFREAATALARLGPHQYVDLGPGSTGSTLLRQAGTPPPPGAYHALVTPFEAGSRGVDRVAGRIQPARRKGTDVIAYVFPGQGSQRKGMGDGLFDRFADLTACADEILGYSVRQLCLQDPHRQLGHTEYTQPALYVVNALSYLDKVTGTGRRPDYLAGHSLGEYVALFAADVYDFATGLRLVAKRGALMAAASGGGMAAVLGLPPERVREVLAGSGLDRIDLANLNGPTQVVVSGPVADIQAAEPVFLAAGARAYSKLNVSGAFHSRMMAGAQREFAEYLRGFHLAAPRIPVISNVSARPYPADGVAACLVAQITGSVDWIGTVRYLLAQGGADTKIEQVGPGAVLSGLVRDIRRDATAATPPVAPPPVVEPRPSAPAPVLAPVVEPRLSVPAPVLSAASEPWVPAPAPALSRMAPSGSVRRPERTSDPVPLTAVDAGAAALGSAEFRHDHGVRYAYVSGSMYRAIASAPLVVRMSRAGMLGFLGTAGLRTAEVEANLDRIRRDLGPHAPYGVNLLHHPGSPQAEDEQVELFLRRGVRLIEASAFMSVTPALVRWRCAGLRRDPQGRVVSDNRMMAKVSRPEVARAFLAPPPPKLVSALLDAGRITAEQARLAPEVCMVDDLTVEADSGGHTDAGVAYALLPSMVRLRDEAAAEHGYRQRVRVGAAGGIGTPEAAAAALVLGADYLVTGSINQCTAEAGTSDEVKDLLVQMGVQDTDYAPAGDMFEMGSRVQVLRRAVFFPARANRLFALYQQYESLDEIDARTRDQLESRYFKRSFEEVYRLVRAYKSAEEVAKAEKSPKYKMLLVFKWYFAYSTQLALEGDPTGRVDYQVHVGPALGAFNSWVKGTALEDWRNRHADEIGLRLLTETSAVLHRRLAGLTGTGNGRMSGGGLPPPYAPEDVSALTTTRLA